MKEKFPIQVKQGSAIASIYSTPTKAGYTSFTVVWYKGTDRKRKVFGNLETARQEAEVIVDSLSRGEIAATDMSSEERAAFLQSKKISAPTGVSLESACTEFAESFKVLNGVSVLTAARAYAKRFSVKIPNKQVSEVVDEFLKSKEKERVSEKYLADLKSKLESFVDRFHCAIAAIDTADIVEFLEALPHGGRTKNNYRQALGTMLQFCKARGYLPKDHEVVEDIKEFKESVFEIDIFTPNEMNQLLEQASGDLVPFLAIAAFAGLRHAEITRLDWEQVSLADGLIEVKAAAAKTGSRRLVPITDNLSRWLAHCAKTHGRVCPRDDMTKLLMKLSNRAGIVWKHNALRHSFISYRLAAIQNVNQVAFEAGNSAQMIFKHYRELVRPADAQKWFSILPHQRTNVIQLAGSVQPKQALERMEADSVLPLKQHG